MTPEDKDALKGLSLAMLNRAQEFSRLAETSNDRHELELSLDRVFDAADALYGLVQPPL